MRCEQRQRIGLVGIDGSSKGWRLRETPVILVKRQCTAEKRCGLLMETAWQEGGGSSDGSGNSAGHGLIGCGAWAESTTARLKEAAVLE